MTGFFRYRSGQTARRLMAHRAAAARGTTGRASTDPIAGGRSTRIAGACAAARTRGASA